MDTPRNFCPTGLSSRVRDPQCLSLKVSTSLRSFVLLYVHPCSGIFRPHTVSGIEPVPCPSPLSSDLPHHRICSSLSQDTTRRGTSLSLALFARFQGQGEDSAQFKKKAKIERSPEFCLIRESNAFLVAWVKHWRLSFSLSFSLPRWGFTEGPVHIDRLSQQLLTIHPYKQLGEGDNCMRTHEQKKERAHVDMAKYATREDLRGVYAPQTTDMTAWRPGFDRLMKRGQEDRG